MYVNGTPCIWVEDIQRRSQARYIQKKGQSNGCNGLVISTITLSVILSTCTFWSKSFCLYKIHKSLYTLIILYVLMKCLNLKTPENNFKKTINRNVLTMENTRLKDVSKSNIFKFNSENSKKKIFMCLLFDMLKPFTINVLYHMCIFFSSKALWTMCLFFWKCAWLATGHTYNCNIIVKIIVITLGYWSVCMLIIDITPVSWLCNHYLYYSTINV